MAKILFRLFTTAVLVAASGASAVSTFDGGEPAPVCYPYPCVR